MIASSGAQLIKKFKIREVLYVPGVDHIGKDVQPEFWRQIVKIVGW